MRSPDVRKQLHSESAIASANSNYEAYGHKRRRIQSVLLVQIRCIDHDSFHHQLCTGPLLSQNTYVLHYLHLHRRSVALRHRLVYQATPALCGRPVRHWLQRLLNNLPVNGDVLLVHSLLDSFCIQHRPTVGKVNTINQR